MPPIFTFRLPALVCIVGLLNSCDEGSPGNQQRLAELEARLAAKQQDIAELQTKLQDARSNSPAKAASSSAPDDHSQDIAAVGAAAEEVARSLGDKLKPGQLSVSGQVAYAGFALKTTSGSQGVAVPFFRDTASSMWRCGWSTEQIQSALTGSAAQPAAVTTPPQAFAPSSAPAPIAAAPAPQTQPRATTGTSQPGLPRGWTSDPATGQVLDANGTPMPALKKGERYGMIQGSEGDTPRPVVIGADGTPKIIIH